MAAIQMVSGTDLQANLQSAAQLISEAAAAGAELILLPENFAYMGGRDTLAIGREELADAGPIRSFVAAQARAHGAVLVAGSLPTCAADEAGVKPPEGKVFTASFVYGPNGQMLARYNKMHLFDVDVDDAQGRYRESDDFCAGHSVQTVAVDSDWTLGLSICYDLRFPELYRALVSQGANLITVPAAFTYTTGEAHWEVLLRARAIENQCFIIAANQGGQHSTSRKTWGHSCIISPWGDVLALQEQGEGVVVADLSLTDLQRRRRTMPALQHRRL
ncbi:carbon-nitrogen hydrolase family protein [Candidatus Pelagadaptatus aseana]|uniref:carbon-nitrogen hydrolase family protein n=1 Tax=Candidatus Pelagadaptatus aseana TaxID=3120508 RepID=UPI003C6F3464